MAVTLLTTKMAGAIEYTHTTDTSADFGAVPNNTYFFNKADKLTYYKDTTGNVLVIFGTAFSSTGSSAWKPLDIALDSWLSNGASTLVNPNAGFQKSFSGTANNAVLAQCPLDHEGILYDGSTMKLRLSWQISGAIPAVTDTVIWRLAYVFVATGEDGDSKAATTIDTTIVVGGRTINQIYVDDLPNMSGAVGSKFLGITLSRISTGGGSDTYPGLADVFAIEIIKL